jgi:hypothetical protein
MASWLPQLGLTLLPNLGGIASGYVTKDQIKTWYSVR